MQQRHGLLTVTLKLVTAMTAHILITVLSVKPVKVIEN